MKNTIVAAAIIGMSAVFAQGAAAEKSASVEANVDLNLLIDQGAAIISGFKSDKNNLVVVVENYTKKPFNLGMFKEKKNSVTQGDVRAGFRQTSKDPKKGLTKVDFTRIDACSNWAMFGWRAHSANAKAFINVIPTYVKKPSAVSFYAASKKGGATFGYFRRGGTAVNKDPKTLKGFKKIARASTNFFVVAKSMWGFSDDLKFVYNLQDGNKNKPATWTMQIRYMNSKKDCK